MQIGSADDARKIAEILSVFIKAWHAYGKDKGCDLQVFKDYLTKNFVELLSNQEYKTVITESLIL